MGKGIVKANNGNGAYTVEIVFDRTRIDAELALLAENRQTLEDKLYTGTPEQDDILRLQIASIDKRVAYINETAPENVQVSSNCIDYTDDIELETEVGTIEIARRDEQVWKTTDPENPYLYTTGYWIRPGFGDGAVYNATRDGILNPTVNQSAASVYYNLAMLPGAQKWRPRYRRGVITSINGNLCDLTLTDLVYLTDDKTEIDIDQDLNKIDVSIEYMDCNGEAFDVDDAVIVEFTGQDWSQPKVIGFYDDPQPCGIFYYTIVFGYQDPLGQYNDWYDHLYFRLDPTGNFTWLDNDEVDALSVNTDDWFTKTYQRAFYPVPQQYRYSFTQDTYRAGNPQPSPWGDFDNLYASGWQYYTPGGVNFFYQVDDMKLHLFESESAIGFSTSKFTKTWLTSHLRKITTVTELVSTPGRWNGFEIKGEETRPGTYNNVIATYSLTGFELINGVLTDIRPYMTSVPGYVYSIYRSEICVVATTRTIYDSSSTPTKAGYSPGTAPTVDTFLDYLYPQTVSNILNRYPLTPYLPSEFFSESDIQFLDDNNLQMDYSRTTNYAGVNSEPLIRISPRNCGGRKMYLASVTGVGVDGYEGIIHGPWWVFPRDDYQWVNPWNVSGGSNDISEIIDYPILGENWYSTENDKRGTNNWYNFFLQNPGEDNRLYEFFWREISNQYRFVINYKYKSAQKSIVLITQKNGEYVSEFTSDEYQTFSAEDGDAKLYERTQSTILTNEYIAATPPHFSAGWSEFYNAKRAEYTAQGKTVDFVSSIWPILN